MTQMLTRFHQLAAACFCQTGSYKCWRKQFVLGCPSLPEGKAAAAAAAGGDQRDLDNLNFPSPPLI